MEDLPVVFSVAVETNLDPIHDLTRSMLSGKGGLIQTER